MNAVEVRRRHPEDLPIDQEEGHDALHNVSTSTEGNTSSDSEKKRESNDMKHKDEVNHSNNNNISNISYISNVSNNTATGKNKSLNNSSSMKNYSSNNYRREAPDPILCPTDGNRSSSSSNPNPSWNTVAGIRIVLFLLLLLAVALVSFGILRIARGRDQQEFEAEYSILAKTVVDAMQDHFHQMIRALDHMSISASTQARAAGSTWPYVEIPDFDIQGESARNLANMSLLGILPVVTDVTRSTWEDFSVLRSYWRRDLSETRTTSTTSTSSKTVPLYNKKTYSSNRILVSNDDGEPTISRVIYQYSSDTYEPITDNSTGPFLPIWQLTPLHEELINYNLLSHAFFGLDLQIALTFEEIVVGLVVSDQSVLDPFQFLIQDRQKGAEQEEKQEDSDDQTNQRNLLRSNGDKSMDHSSDPQRLLRRMEESPLDPMSMVFFPIFTRPLEPRQMVGIVAAAFFWNDVFFNVLPSGTQPLLGVLENQCGQVFSLLLTSDGATVLGQDDLHHPQFDDLKQSFGFRMPFQRDHMSSMTYTKASLNLDYCPYKFTVYPTIQMKQSFRSKNPFFYISMAVGVILFAVIVFCIHNSFMRRRRRRIVSQTVKLPTTTGETVKCPIRAPVLDLRCYKTVSQSQDSETTAATSDYFAHTTVMFADVVGFEVWSATREPNEVFSFLEALYGVFDSIAQKRKVFNVDLIGGRYVAVTGVLEVQPKHAQIMARFAGECLAEMNQQKRELQVTFGSDTGLLQLRVGLHSGPVTAGILRGRRFQIFGDTVNLASEIERSCHPNQIQCSQVTADLLAQAGKGHWVSKREDRVRVKDVGDVQTYWVQFGSSGSPPCDTHDHVTNDGQHSIADTSQASDVSTIGPTDLSRSTTLFTVDSVVDKEDKQQRLVDWYVDLMTKLLREVVATRTADDIEQDFSASVEVQGSSPYDEVVESISLPIRNPEDIAKASDRSTSTVDERVISELKDFVATIACMYRENPFHDFEHSSHVSMSALQLLKRIASALVKDNSFNPKVHSCASSIMEDALGHFAIIFSTLIHDVDHYGVSNEQLVEENADLAILYRNKSVAEQNSIDLAWDLFMEPSYENLRICLFSSESEFIRFRRLVVNSIIATDLFDADLSESRKERWQRAFVRENRSQNDIESLDLKVTVLIEYIMQASDIAHTMQHWYVYEKWNERLFHEMFSSFVSGRGNRDLAKDWYNGELRFFDNFVIPIAKQLNESNLFGSWGDEYEKYALANRTEWESQGRSLVQKWVVKYTDVSVANPKKIEPVAVNEIGKQTSQAVKVDKPMVRKVSHKRTDLPTIIEQDAEAGSASSALTVENSQFRRGSASAFIPIEPATKSKMSEGTSTVDCKRSAKVVGSTDLSAESTEQDSQVENDSPSIMIASPVKSGVKVAIKDRKSKAGDTEGVASRTAPISFVLASRTEPNEHYPVSPDDIIDGKRGSNNDREMRLIEHRRLLEDELQVVTVESLTSEDFGSVYPAMDMGTTDFLGNYEKKGVGSPTTDIDD